jgi:hypothetical protein
MDVPSPDISDKPHINGLTVVEVIYLKSNELRCIATIDSIGVYRLGTEYWDISESDIVKVVYWAEHSSGTLTV